MSGNLTLLAFCIVIALVSIICMFITSIPNFGNKIISRISDRLYSKEGSVTTSVPESMKKKKWLGYLVGPIFAICVLSSVILGSKGFFPIELMQPISALYVVPFIVFLYFWQRPMISPIALLWPTLYAIHAILIVAGVPIVFSDGLTALNMLIPTAGYGLLSGLIGHLYSRYALKKLKGISSPQRETEN